jgi:chemotaxis protein histidine kinase CheA
MAEIKHDKPGITKYVDHEVIVVPNRLKKKALRHAAADATDPLSDAELALEELSGQFSEWMEDECQALDTARQQVHQDGLTDATRQALFRAAHDIKGHGTTFGYPMASDVADSLCRLMEHAGPAAQIPLAYIDQCVDAVRAIIREHADENADEIATLLAKELRVLTDELLGVDETPDEPAGASPPLAPG